jgi:hypothetical protein
MSCRLTVAIAACLIAASIPASAADSLRDAEAVLSRSGQPSAVWYDDDGLEVWDYNGNPFRFTGLRYRFDTDGRLVREEDPRREEVVATLASGMTARQVRDRIGEPPTMFFIRDEPHWEWRILWQGRRPHRLIVQFDKTGVVKAVARYPLDAGAGRGNR